MPRAKRPAKLKLEKTDKKHNEGKKEKIDKTKVLFSEYDNLFIIEVVNMNGPAMRAARDGMKGDGVITMLKSSLVRAALGSTEENEVAPNSREIHAALGGSRGMFFTNLSLEDVKKRFAEFTRPDFIKPGEIATETITISVGPLHALGDEEGNGAVVRTDGTVVKAQPLNSQSIVNYLRRLDVSCELRDCVIYVLKPFTICEEGKPVDPRGCRLLRLLGQPGTAGGEFKINVIGQYERGTGVKMLV